MELTITVDIDLKQSGLTGDELKDNIIDFTKDLLINGAEEQDVTFALKEVSYSE